MAWKWRGGQWNIGEKYHGEMMSMYRYYCCGSVVGYNVPHRLQKTGKQDWQQKRDKVWSDNNNALYCNGWTKNAWYNTHALMHDLIRGDAFITNRQVLLRNNRRTEYSWYCICSGVEVVNQCVVVLIKIVKWQKIRDIVISQKINCEFFPQLNRSTWFMIF